MSYDGPEEGPSHASKVAINSAFPSQNVGARSNNEATKHLQGYSGRAVISDGLAIVCARVLHFPRHSFPLLRLSFLALGRYKGFESLRIYSSSADVFGLHCSSAKIHASIAFMEQKWVIGIANPITTSSGASLFFTHQTSLSHMSSRL